MVNVVPTTILATGRVAKFSIGANFEPINLPTKTTIELTDNKSACEMVSIQILCGRLFILLN